MQMHKQNQVAALDAAAFAVSERARARALLELLTESRVDFRQGVDGSLLERERSLQQLLNAKAAVRARLLNRKHTPEQADAAAKEIASITSEYDEVKAQIRARSTRYAALTQPQPLDLAEIQQQVLDEGTLLLEYALGESLKQREQELASRNQELEREIASERQRYEESKAALEQLRLQQSSLSPQFFPFY
jgi:hypothetical protein